MDTDTTNSLLFFAGGACGLGAMLIRGRYHAARCMLGMAAGQATLRVLPHPGAHAMLAAQPCYVTILGVTCGLIVGSVFGFIVAACEMPSQRDESCGDPKTS